MMYLTNTIQYVIQQDKCVFEIEEINLRKDDVVITRFRSIRRS